MFGCFYNVEVLVVSANVIWWSLFGPALFLLKISLLAISFVKNLSFDLNNVSNISIYIIKKKNSCSDEATNRNGQKRATVFFSSSIGAFPVSVVFLLILFFFPLGHHLCFGHFSNYMPLSFSLLEHDINPIFGLIYGLVYFVL
ncbi:hypothetical protein AtNW77_Chr1g0000911 [Arabidopsis thaliana]